MEKSVYVLPSNVTFDSSSVTYDGKEHSITADNIPDGIIPIYHNNIGTDAGRYDVSVTYVLSSLLTSKYSSVEPSGMTATLTIHQAEPTYAVPTGLIAVEGQTLADVNAQLSAGFSFENPLASSVGLPGDNVFLLTFKPGSSNYKTVTGIQTTIHVSKKEIPAKPKFQMPSDITFNDRMETYSGAAYTVTAENVPEELSVAYSSNTRTDAGSQTATATFQLSDKGLELYSGIEGATTMTATLTILQAEPTYTIPTGLNAVEGQALADVSTQLGEGFSFEDEPSTLVGSAGDNEFKVTYTPGSSNYKTISGIIVRIHVKQVYVLPSNVSFPDMEEIYEPDKVWETKVLNLPDDIVTAVYTNNTRSTAGIQRTRVEFHIQPAYADTYGAVSPSSMEAIINVHKAMPQYTKPTGLTAFVGQTLADVAGQLGKGFAFEDAPDTFVGGEDSNNLTVSYTPDDTENYQIVHEILVTIQVSYDYGPVDKTRLAELIAKAEDAIANKDSYAEINYSAFSSAYCTAKDMPESTQQTVDEKVAAIESALALLEREVPDPGDIIDRSNLDQAILVVEALKEKDWIPSRYKATLAGYEAAKSMPEDTQEDIDKKEQAITDALDLLIARPSFTAKPGQVLGDIAGQLGERFAFEEDLSTSVGDLGTNIFHVSYTPEDGGEIEADIEVEVYVSVPGEQPAPDFTELFEIIDETDNIDPFGYTEDSYSAYENAFTTALDMPEDTQKEVDQKVAAIRAALALLVPKAP